MVISVLLHFVNVACKSSIICYDDDDDVIVIVLLCCCIIFRFSELITTKTLQVNLQNKL